MKTVIGVILIVLGVSILLIVYVVDKVLKETTAKWKKCGESEVGHEFNVLGDSCHKCGMPRKFHIQKQ